MSKITLDAETFKALASEARLRVLKALDERRKTLAELARSLELNKATIHEHLQLLTAAGLVKKRDDEGRKWIYYELTWTGSRILHPETTTTFNVLVGLSALAAGGGLFTLGRALGWWLESKGADPGFGPTSTGPAEDSSSTALKAPAPPPAPDPDPAFFDDGGWLALALIACVILFLGLAWMLYHKVSPKPLDEVSAKVAEAASA